jgi:hypothetical protein
MSNINVRSGGTVTRASIASSNTDLGEEDALGDAEALRRAFADPRYSTSASYRKRVEEALAESMAVSSSDANAAFSGTQRFQVTGHPIDAVPAERELTAHEKAMIEKAAKHGL